VHQVMESQGLKGFSVCEESNTCSAKEDRIGKHRMAHLFFPRGFRFFSSWVYLYMHGRISLKGREWERFGNVDTPYFILSSCLLSSFLSCFSLGNRVCLQGLRKDLQIKKKNMEKQRHALEKEDFHGRYLAIHETSKH